MIRLNKVIAQSGICSRRKADLLISRGQVKINGQIVRELGYKIDPLSDQVEVQGQPIKTPCLPDTNHFYLALHKPVKVVSTLSDPQGRKTIVDFLPSEFQGLRLLPAGRLDFMSEGLLLLTSEGELIHRLTHPSWHVAKTYHVWIRGKLSREKLNEMQAGMRLREGQKLGPVQVHIADKSPGSILLEMTLRQGVNRQIRRMCRDLDLAVLRLTRIRQGPVDLGNLAPGQYRLLREVEISRLRSDVGLL